LGAPAYAGWYVHTALGRLRARLIVSCMDVQWYGELEFSDHQGPRQRVLIEPHSERRVTITSMGEQCLTELRGHVARNGALVGEVFHAGEGGGFFKLWPMMQGAQGAQGVQGWSVALCSGRCVEVPTAAAAGAAVREASKAHLPAECAICLQGFAAGELISRTPCLNEGHVFHTSCIQEWLRSHRTCPLCRQSMSPDTEEESSLGCSGSRAADQWFSYY
jgi:hypothetical protein